MRRQGKLILRWCAIASVAVRPGCSKHVPDAWLQNLACGLVELRGPEALAAACRAVEGPCLQSEESRGEATDSSDSDLDETAAGCAREQRARTVAAAPEAGQPLQPKGSKPAKPNIEEL